MLGKIRDVLDGLPMMIAYKDTKNNIITVNKNAADFMGLKVKDLSNIPLKKIFPRDYKRYYSYDMDVIENKRKKLKFVEKHIVLGKKVVVEVSIIPIINDDEKVDNLLLFMTDITEKHRLKIEDERKEKLLQHQSKMAAMGEMLENISHQWRQPLSIISAASTGVKLKKELDSLNDEEFIESMNIINDNAQYLSQTINDFRDFIKPSQDPISKFSISKTIEKTLKLNYSKRVSREIEIIKNIDDIEIFSAENQLIQVLINILNNAIDALSNKKGKRFIFIKVKKLSNNIYLSIKDNAGGINPDYLDRIFEPYFTTKHQSVGTGIGLYMSQEIVIKTLNGTIHVENENFVYKKEKLYGANFIIELPLNS